MSTWHIHIEGRVQGVGFRPFVHCLALDLGLSGTVSNTTDGVHIYFNAPDQIARSFETKLVTRAPQHAMITSVKRETTTNKEFKGFKIIGSGVHESGKGKLYLTPDISICPECRQDIMNPSNRRFDYAFTTCTNCGPRFSITTTLPFDRENTSMSKFEMCVQCESEYHSLDERRYFSQTNSCRECGVSLLSSGERPSMVIDDVCAAWETGQIVAVKGIGGYLLTCDATNTKAIAQLRSRKHRPTKPFATMFGDLEALRHTASITENERKALQSPQAPIVLLELKKETSNAIPFEIIAPGLDRIGVMLPYTPLFQLLLNRFGKPIIATSGNVTNSPIEFHRESAELALSRIADLFVRDNRDIHFPQDDSVVRYTDDKQLRVIMRRSRGLAPSFLPKSEQPEYIDAIATGAMMKSAFAVAKQGQVRISQYLGDLEHYDTELRFQEVLNKFLALDPVTPEYILCDLHPEYPTTRIASRLSNKMNVPLIQIQHHEAHFGAILGEHWDKVSNEKILGVIWDGTGMGTDGHIWGSEMFVYEKGQIDRVGHLEYSKALFGDKPSREPRLAALLRCHHLHHSSDILKPMFTSTEWQLYQTLCRRSSPVLSSSMGRLFDCVAALVGIEQKQFYEGEAAMKLEVIARQWLANNPAAHPGYYPVVITDSEISTDEILQRILDDLVAGIPPGEIALRFHHTLVEVIAQFANAHNVKYIACSGGVFQNSLLIDLITARCEDELNVLLHDQLSANDENIAYGQLVICALNNAKKNLTSKTSAQHVSSDTW